MNLSRSHVTIKGRVQGVGYRAWVKDQAQKLDLTGWVRNLPNGDVECVIEGEEPAVRKMLDLCGGGPALAQVKEVKAEDCAYTGQFGDFELVK